MAFTGRIKIQNIFDDDKTREIEFSGFDSDCAILDPDTLAERVKEVNSDTSAIAAAYLSEDGASFTKINAATIFITEENEINLNAED